MPQIKSRPTKSSSVEGGKKNRKKKTDKMNKRKTHSPRFGRDIFINRGEIKKGGRWEWREADQRMEGKKGEGEPVMGNNWEN